MSDAASGPVYRGRRPSPFCRIQEAIVARNNFGDSSVSANDLELAAACAIRLWIDGDDRDRRELRDLADIYRDVVAEKCPGLMGGPDGTA